MRTAMHKTFIEHPEGTLITVWVVPGASSSGIVGRHDEAIKVRVSEPAEGGRANPAVEALLAEALDARVVLRKGSTQRRKQFLVAGVRPNRVEALLEARWRTGSG